MLFCNEFHFSCKNTFKIQRGILSGGMKKVNNNFFLFVDPVARVLRNRTIETVTKRCLSQKIPHLKVPMQHVLDVYTTTKFIQPNMV